MQGAWGKRLYAQGVSAAIIVFCGVSLSAAAPADPDNPTCPPLAQADLGPNKPMGFRIETSPQGKILLAEGTFDAQVAQRLDQFLLRNAGVDEIWLKSTGGVASQGPEVGKVIRRYGVPTRVPSGWWCISACTLAFLGGPIRYLDDDAHYAVHMFTTTNNEAYQGRIMSDRKKGEGKAILNDIAEREQGSALAATEQNDYMLRMGVSRKLLAEIMYKQKATSFDDRDRSTIRCMSLAEAKRYNVINTR